MSKTRVAFEVSSSEIADIFASLDQGGLPGATVGVAVAGRPVYRNGFGLANMESSTILMPSTRLRLGSTTKHFTALAYMLLCEEGRANPEDPIRKYLPELHQVADGVTVRHLMTHTSGLRDTFDLSMVLNGVGRSASTEDLLRPNTQISDTNFAPGTSWSYSNSGYQMLTIAIERLTGQLLEAVLRERIFLPVGMHDTMLRRLDRDFVSSSATLHASDGNGGFTKDYMGMALAGEGGVVSTVDDMLRWLAHMDAPHVGSQATWSTMRRAQELSNGFSTGYGLGLMTGTYRGMTTLHHAGGVLGGRCQMIKLPEAKLDIIVIANRDDVSPESFAERIIDVCVPDLDPVEADVSHESFHGGSFYSTNSGRLVRLSEDDGKLSLSVDGVPFPARLHPGGIFRATLEPFRQAFAVRNHAQHSDRILISEFGNEEELTAVQPPDSSSTSGIEGNFRSNEFDVTAEIVSSAGENVLVMTGRLGSMRYSLSAVTAGVWSASSLEPLKRFGATVIHDADGIRFTTLRNRNLRFVRIA